MSVADSRLDEAARRVAEQLPPLTDEQRDQLRTLLAPALDPRGVDVTRRVHRRAPRPQTEGRYTYRSADAPTPLESTAVPSAGAQAVWRWTR